MKTVIINAPKSAGHPHNGETGILTGEVLSTGQVVVKLDDCPHMIDSCGVDKEWLVEVE